MCERCKKHIVKYTTLQILGRNMYAVGRRRGLLKKLVDDYKFNCEREAAKVLAEFLDDSLPVYEDFTVTFIPTVSAHIRERSFDHMMLVARRFAQRRNLRFKSLLYRRDGESQKHLSKSGRQKAASKTFGLRNVKMPEKVLLLDDIHTTGATVAAARKLLIKGGAKKVVIAVICKQ